MTVARFSWQRDQVRRVLDKNNNAVILNVGCNEDPAQLKLLAPHNVVNCDLHSYDESMNRPNRVDVIMDATQTWPFDDNFADLVVLGDIIEHLHEHELDACLREARRVAHEVAITVPHDPRFLTEENYDEKVRSMQRGAIHITPVNEEYLRAALARSRWEVVEWHKVDYVFVPEGFFVLCSRDALPST